MGADGHTPGWARERISLDLESLPLPRRYANTVTPRKINHFWDGDL